MVFRLLRFFNTVAGRILVAAAALFFVAIFTFAAAMQLNGNEAAEDHALSEARLLAQQMKATWDYIGDMQGAINYNSDGSYDFKKVYCSVAGKNIANRFTNNTDAEIRFVRENPRSSDDFPDEFESEALRAFSSGESEYYAVVTQQEKTSFRYLAVLEMEGSCLSCHGEPAGVIDETGFPREGMKLGDVAGAISIDFPLADYQMESEHRAILSVMLFVTLLLAFGAVSALLMQRWVGAPMRKMIVAARQIGDGAFDCPVVVDGPTELESLAANLDEMRIQMKNSYEKLENAVASRTKDLEEANLELELRQQEISAMNRQLVTANEQLEREGEYKSIFLSTMSHELRAPLVAIVSHANKWLRLADKKNSEDIYVMRRIAESGQALLKMTNDILDAARIDAGRFELEMQELDVFDLANEIESVVSPIARDKGITLSVGVEGKPPLIRSDISAISKILINLLSNAIKFTDTKGFVRASLAVDVDRSELVIVVSDTGIGISENDLEVVFERFRQADASISRRFGGSGLGLSLVKDMVHLLDGAIELSSEVGKGSKFTITIPCELLV